MAGWRSGLRILRLVGSRLGKPVREDPQMDPNMVMRFTIDIYRDSIDVCDLKWKDMSAFNINQLQPLNIVK